MRHRVSWPGRFSGQPMRIAFYAPMKPPDHPVPSGDRRIAQLFLEALRLAGHQPVLVSHLRSFDARGDRDRQARLAALGRRLADRALRRWRAAPTTAPDLWFTYHVYHKAPDWLGPTLSAALGIPYVVAEASFAPKQARGPWAPGHRAAEQAIRQADAVIGLNPADRACVLPLLVEPSRWVAMKPFIDAYRLTPCLAETREAPRLIAAAMMRSGDKLASYRILGEALAGLLDLDWTLEVVGDGVARAEVMMALAPLDGRAIWAGSLDADSLERHLAAADLYVWPAINEAFGMALLEAQASGLPVVAGASGGVAEIVAHEITGLLVTPGDAATFAAAARRLIADASLRRRYAAAARRRVLAEHDLPAAAARLGAVIEALRPARAA
jgi:glycosyltransferase involved in cell wall biosynthesis